MKVSYQKSFDRFGTVYTQTLSMSCYEANDWNEKIKTEIRLGLPNKQFYIYTSGNEIFMKPFIPAYEGCWDIAYAFLNLTQLYFIRHFANNPRILDRNTRIALK